MSTSMWISSSVFLLLALALFELAARWWIRRSGYYVLTPGMRLRVYPDREVFPQLEKVVRFDVNRDGERGDDPPRSDEGLYRVLVAGGSQPEGYLLDQATSWPGALQERLDTEAHLRRLGARRVHVGSIARSGVGAEALDLIFDRVLPRYRRLDAIVILIGASDVLRWLEEGAPSSPPPAVQPDDVFRWHPEMRFGWRLRRLAILELLTRLRRRWLRPIDVQPRAARWIASARASRASAAEIRTSVPDPSPMLEHFERRFRRLLARAAAHADRVLVVRQPWFDKEFSSDEAAHMWHGGAGQVWKRPVTSYYSFQVVSRLMRLLDARAARVCDELEIEHLDLMPLLDRSLRTYYDCFHLTPAGARDVADAVAAELLGRPFAGTRILRSGVGGAPAPERPAVHPAPIGETAGGWAALRHAE
jgi:lysophospholipase L1-like esterase